MQGSVARLPGRRNTAAALRQAVIKLVCAPTRVLLAHTKKRCMPAPSLGGSEGPGHAAISAAPGIAVIGAGQQPRHVTLSSTGAAIIRSATLYPFHLRSVYERESKTCWPHASSITTTPDDSTTTRIPAVSSCESCCGTAIGADGGCLRDDMHPEGASGTDPCWRPSQLSLQESEWAGLNRGGGHACTRPHEIKQQASRCFPLTCACHTCSSGTIPTCASSRVNQQLSRDPDHKTYTRKCKCKCK